MDNQEAIKALRELRSETNDSWYEAVYDMAISALKKQIPKQPIVITDGCDNSFWHLYCPTCGAAVGVYSKRLKNTAMYNSTNSKICAQCGQTFDLELQESE